MADDREDRNSFRINAANPNQMEMRLALESGGPESLEEAVDRINRGEPVIRPAEDEAEPAEQ